MKSFTLFKQSDTCITRVYMECYVMGRYTNITQHSCDNMMYTNIQGFDGSVFLEFSSDFVLRCMFPNVSYPNGRRTYYKQLVDVKNIFNFGPTLKVSI